MGDRFIVASKPYIYSGQDFSLQGDKNRFVLPSWCRTSLKESSGGLIVCLGKDEELDCLVGFGISRRDELLAQFDREQRESMKLGKAFSAVTRGMALFGVTELPFDASGRFILPEAVATSAQIGSELYFHGAGYFFTAWNPDVLLKQGPEFDGAKAICMSLRAKAREKGKASTKTGAKTPTKAKDAPA